MTDSLDTPPLQRARRILTSIRGINRAMHRAATLISDEFGITHAQLDCLRTAQEHGPLSGRELAARLKVSPSTVVGLLDRLEARNLLVRRRDPDNRRKLLLEPSDRGRAVLARAASPMTTWLATELATLDEPDQARLSRAFEQLATLLELRKDDESDDETAAAD